MALLTVQQQSPERRWDARGQWLRSALEAHRQPEPKATVTLRADAHAELAEWDFFPDCATSPARAGGEAAVGPSLIPQAHGGALLSGGKPGNPGHNQHTVRERAQAVRGELVAELDAICEALGTVGTTDSADALRELASGETESVAEAALAAAEQVQERSPS